MSSKTHNLPELFYVYGSEELYNDYGDGYDTVDWQALYKFFKDQGIRVSEGAEEYHHVDWDFCFYSAADRSLFLLTFGEWFSITKPVEDTEASIARYYNG